MPVNAHAAVGGIGDGLEIERVVEASADDVAGEGVDGSEGWPGEK